MQTTLHRQCAFHRLCHQFVRRLFWVSLTVLLLSPAASMGESFNPQNSPFADKPAVSYSGYTDEQGQPGVLKWGQAPFQDFGSRTIKFNPAGVRPLRPAPAPGVHPRIFFGPDELADVRQRLKDTRCGQESWKNILCWTEMMKGTYDDTASYAQPDRWNGSFGGLRGRVPLFRLGVQREGGAAYNKHPKAAAIYQALADGTATDFPEFYWNTMALEAFRCLIDNDEAAGKKLSAAVITAMKIGQAKRAADPKKAGQIPDQPVGAFQLAYCYDFLFNWMTSEQRQALQSELAASTWSHDNYGTFNTAESSRSNWATFSYWLIQVLAIEGEPGFNELKVRGMYRGWRNLMTYGWFASGANFEGEGKNQIGMDGVILFTKRAQQYGFENLSGHPYLQAYARNFLPHSANAMLTGFHKYDLLGGSRSGKGSFAPMDVLGFKFMFPEDKAIDWVYRQSMGENYEGVPDRPDGYFNALLFYAIFAQDYMPNNNDPAKLDLGLTYFCGERALMMSRSAWDKEAMQLNMHVRQANGGHPFADRNGIMVAGAGRIWSPNGYANFRTFENSVVSIDDKSQNEWIPARCVDYVEQPHASFMVGDAKYPWDWNWQRLDKPRGYYTAQDVDKNQVVIPPGWSPVTQTVNDFAYTKLPYDYLNQPHFRYPHWIKPKGALSPYVRQALYPVQKAFRTAGLVRGLPSPYGVVVDDIRMDDSSHRYDWNLILERDIQIVSHKPAADGSLDILLTGADPDQAAPAPKEPLPPIWPGEAPIPAGHPMLWVKVLDARQIPDAKAVDPTIVELDNASDPKKYSHIRRLVVSAQSVEPGFKVILLPHRQGQPKPTISWDRQTQTAKVTQNNITDVIKFTPGPDGKTDVVITRTDAGKATEIVRVEKEIPPLKDTYMDELRAQEQKARERVKTELAQFKPEALPALAAAWDFSPGATTEGFPALNDPTLHLPASFGQVVPRGSSHILQASGSITPLPGDFLSNDNECTVAFWFSDTESKGGAILQANGNKGLGLSLENNKFLRIDGDGKHRLYMAPLATKDWTHVAVTWDGQSYRLYLNGLATWNAAATTSVNMGKTANLTPGFKGQLDHLLFFQRALSAEEIEKIYLVQRYRTP